MNLENHQVIGSAYPVSWEADEESNTTDQFKLWLEDAESEALYFANFIEHWHPAELFSFMQRGSLQAEFKKYYIKNLKEDFAASEGLSVSSKQVLESAA